MWRNTLSVRSMPQPLSDMAQATYEEIRNAHREQRSGKYRLIAQRLINGHKCRCYAYVVMVGTVAYWNVEYIADGNRDSVSPSLVTAMYEIASAKAVDLCAKGQETVLWTY